MSYEVVRLGDVADIVSGKNAPKDNDLGNIGVPFIRAGNLEYLCEVGLENNLEKINAEINEKYRFNILPKQSVIFAKSGMSILKDRVYLTKEDTFIVNHLAGIITNNEILYPKYLKYYLYIKKPSSLVNDTSYPSLRLEDIKEIQIPLPLLDIQKKIADTLDKAQELIDKRKEQISALDKFLENLFLDMFGDPVSNPMGWEVKKLVEVAKINMGQSPLGESYNVEGLGEPLLNGPTEFGKKYPKEKQWTTQPRKYCEKDDILFCVRGATAGRMNYADKVYCIGRGLASIKAEHTVSTSYIYLILQGMYKIFQSTSNGSTFINIDKNTLENVNIPITPLDLQNQFASIVEKVEAEKTKLEASLKEMEDNFNSIMQRAFKGELF